MIKELLAIAVSILIIAAATSMYSTAFAQTTGGGFARPGSGTLNTGGSGNAAGANTGTGNTPSPGTNGGGNNGNTSVDGVCKTWCLFVR
jgi:hypothetical protein